MNEPGSQYEIVEKLGEGGMGKVFLARDTILERYVAIKQLHQSVEIQDVSIGERFQSEALALARLNHPNITHLYAFLPRDEGYWMVMEYVEEKTLEDWLAIHKKIDHQLAGSIVIQMLDGLRHAHAKGIIHRDMKPANVMINDEGEIKIMDFGIARMRDAHRITSHGKSVGTLEYMSPEQIRGQEGDERSDVYAVATIFYELLCGEAPFLADSDYQLMKDKLESSVTPISRHNPEVPPGLQRTIIKALDKNPDRRPASADAFKKEIESNLNTEVLPRWSLSSLLKTSQTLSEPAKPGSLLSVNSLLERAKSISGRFRVPDALAVPRHFVILGASVVVCLILLFWASGSDTPEKVAVKNEDSYVGVSNDADPSLPSVNQTSQGDFDETPGEMYQRISAQPKVQNQESQADDRRGLKEPVQKSDYNKSATRKDVPVQKQDDKTPVAQAPFDIPGGTTFAVTLSEDLSSEEEDRDGAQIRFVVRDNVIVNGKIVVRKGARVTGKIVDVIPSSNARKKALIGFIIQQAEAVDGSLLKLRSERYRLFSDMPGEPVSYKRGATFNVELRRARLR